MKRSQRVKKDRAKRVPPAAEAQEELKQFIAVEDDPTITTTETKRPDMSAWERARLLLAWESVRFE